MEHNRKANVSFALWIPTIWFMIIGSRMVCYWLGPTQSAADATEEGNPIDRLIFMLLILVGIFAVLKRKIFWADFVRNNSWLIIYFMFCAISFLWSDFPLVTFKRFIKAVGSLIMVLIILTEQNQFDAIKTMIRRTAYILIPLSIILIKYYPHLGRMYHRWTGELSITGVASNKNGLGALCMVCGITLVADLFSTWHTKITFAGKNKIIFFSLVILIMTIWLLIKSNSATSLTCFIIGCLTLITMSVPLIKNNIDKFGICAFCLLFIGFILQYSFDIITATILALGRDATLTGRTEIWKFALEMVTKPLLGAGFESFWLGDNVERMNTAGMRIGNEVHNGYLEIYLDLGWIGLLLLTAVIVNAYRNVTKILKDDFEYGRLLMAFFIIVVFYNITESAFRPMQLLGFIFLIVAVGRPQPLINKIA